MAQNDTVKISTDTVKKEQPRQKPAVLAPYHRNVIKFNPTPMLLWGEIRNITFSYERLLKNNQSVSVQAGFLSIPRILNDTILVFIVDRKGEKGVNLAFDYRWYPGVLNRRPAPNGLYIGGYASYYGFSYTNDFSFRWGESTHLGHLDGALNFANLGLEIGYQFIFWKRLSVDLLMFGPSLTYFFGRGELTSDLSPEAIADLDQAIVDRILEKYPAFSFLGGGESLVFSKSETKFHTFFRYSIQVGFHF